MKTNIRFFLILLALAGLVACSTPIMIKSPETGAGVSGTVSYLQRIALSPDAVAHVLLVDVTSPDAPRTIAGQTINRPERVPFRSRSIMTHPVLIPNTPILSRHASDMVIRSALSRARPIP